jgi:hypothetical protein
LISTSAEEAYMTNTTRANAAGNGQPDTLLSEVTDHPVDRPGCDFGGATGLTAAGLGIGLGENSADTPLERSLPGRRFTGTLTIPHWRGPQTG